MSLALAFAQVPREEAPVPTQPSEPPPASLLDNEGRRIKRQKTLAAMSRRSAQREDKFSEALVIHVVPEAMADLKASDPGLHQQCLEIAGRWFKVGNCDGSPIYRQEAPSTPDQTNKHELFLSRHDAIARTEHRGWYVSNALGCEAVDDAAMVAWGPSRPQEPQTWPLLPHVPYWSKKATKALVVMSYVSWLEGQVMRDAEASASH